VQVVAQNDKRGETITVAVTRSNEILPFQIIWAGLSKRSIPKIEWPPGFVNCFAGRTGTRVTKSGNQYAKSNKWQNLKTISEYLNLLIKPYIEFCRADPIIKEELQNFPKKDRALFICDQHWSHMDDVTTNLLKSFNCDYKYIYGGATDIFSALDVGICKPVKSFFRSKFEKYCASQIASQLEKDIPPSNVKVNLKLSALKPLAANWMVECFDYLTNQQDLAKNAWDGVKANLEQYICIGLPPLSALPTYSKCVVKFLESLNSNDSKITNNYKNNSSNNIEQENDDIEESDEEKEDENDAVENENENAENEENEKPEENENEIHDLEEKSPNHHNNKNNNTRKNKKIPTGSIISVLWNDGDGQRWEHGRVQGLLEGSRYTYIVRYDFLEKASAVDPSAIQDPDVLEKLIGKEKAKWKYIKKAE